MTIKNHLIRLGSSNPELRPHIRKILNKISMNVANADWSDVVKEMDYLTKGARKALQNDDSVKAHRFTERMVNLVLGVKWEYRDEFLNWFPFERSIEQDLRSKDLDTLSKAVEDFSKFWAKHIVRRMQ